MSETVDTLLDPCKTCRTCLQLKTSEELVPLSHDNYLISLNQIANIQLALIPTLPTNICHSCLNNLNAALNFVKQIHTSEAYLKSIENTENLTVIYKTFTVLDNAEQNISEIITQQVDNVWMIEEPNEEITESTVTETNVIKWADKQTFNCDLCSKTFRFEFIYKKHLLKHGTLMECEVCLQQFEDVNAFVMHTKSTHRDYKLFACPCKQRFYTLGSLKAHYQRHTPEKSKKFTCDLCGKRFARHNSLTIHRRSHTSKTPYTCEICHKKLSGSHSLGNHLKIHKGEKKHNCAICGSTFIHRFSLTAHMRIHTGEKPFACNICHSKFSSNSYLKVHIRTHTLEKPYKCKWCQKRFTSRCSLTAHEKAHTGEKKYQCDYCGWRSARSADLQTHIRKHTGEKPYSCNQCDKSYKTASNLAYHKKTHLGLKEFVCPTCSRAFGDPRTLKSHIRIHTGETPYQCHVCGARFKQSGQLSGHRKRHLKTE
ncbi:unnamed protein product [Ceutorhynchus assimilis]|uniref:Uncharacterized protein n=1 Tax=Ceutorhynchus assimilis TaxID=467358 RepID=A0A9N9N2H7_9CUCU|nr:unnamed protein product [Ceutorhynchus assimilis]